MDNKSIEDESVEDGSKEDKKEIKWLCGPPW